MLLVSFGKPFIDNPDGPEPIKESTALKKTEFRMATYNIRYRAKADVETGNAWEIRKKPLADLILKSGFDIVATQEGDSTQLQELKMLLPDFEYVGHPYGGKNHNLHNCATYYRKSLFEVMDQGVFWFSETPDVPSIGWDATDRRICYWTKFRAKDTGDEFFMFNVHFYWRLQEARAASGPLLVNKIKEIAGGVPTVVLGDFNSLPETEQIRNIKTVLKDAYEKTISPPQGITNTAFSGGVFQGNPKARIDYIFVSPHFTVSDYKVHSDTYADDRYPSDHLPVSALLRF